MNTDNRKAPCYDFEKFRKACGKEKDSVIPIGDVLRDAAEFFSLRTKTALLNFIFNFGLENLNFINSKEWENNPDKNNSLMVDSYEFRSRFKLGYIAFMRNPKTKKWIIKSFHLSENMNPTIMAAFNKARLLN